MPNLATTNRWIWFSITIIFLLPSLFHCYWNPKDSVDFLFWGILASSILTGIVISIPYRLVRWIVYSMLFVFSLFELAHMLVYEGDLASAGFIRSLFMTTPYEADGAVLRIIKQHIEIISCIAIFYLIVSVQIWLTTPMPTRKTNVFIGIMIVVFTIPYFLFPQKIFTPPTNVYTQIKEAVSQFQERSNETPLGDDFIYHAHRNHTPQNKEVYILVLEESIRYKNISLNNPNVRTTTPRLEQEKNIVSYTDYYANGVFTMYAVPMIVTRATPESFIINYREKGVQQAYTETGFRTYWLTNEAQMVNDGVSQYITRGAEIISAKNDLEIPSKIDSLLSINEKIFVIVHLWGNHQFYFNSQHSTAVYYPNVTTSTDVQGEEMYRNSYDNCILCMDSIMYAITSLLKEEECVAQWVLVSDHGEGKINKNGGAHGYAHPTKDEYHVPLMVWYSDEYAAVYPDKVANMIKHKDEPVCGDHVFWSVLDMAGIEIDSTLQQEGMSIFGDSLRSYKRTLLLPDGRTIMEL